MTAKRVHPAFVETASRTKRPRASGKPRHRADSQSQDSSTTIDDRVVVLASAPEIGLNSGKRGRISGRVSAELIERAKACTGLQSDTELIEFALTNIVVEDEFFRVFRDLKSTVDPELYLGI